MPIMAAIGLGGAGLVSSGIFGYLGAEEQSDAAMAALDQQRAMYSQQVMASSLARANAADEMRQGGMGAQQAMLEGIASSGANLVDYGNLARGDMAAGINQARGDIGTSLGQAQTQLGEGARGAQGALSPLAQMMNYQGGASTAINPYDVMGGIGQSRQDISNSLGQAQQQMTQGGQAANDTISKLMAQDPYANFEADPGYQFRLAAGENAIKRQASAAGGRLSGRTLSALTDMNQNMASAEYQNFANRGLQAKGQNAALAGQLASQQAGLGQNLANQTMGAGTAMSGLQAQGTLNQAGRSDQAQLAAQGNQMNLAGIGAGAQTNLANLYSNLGQGMATNTLGAGNALANLGQNYGQGMSNLGMTMGNNLANLGMTGSTNVANQLWGQGQSLGNLYMASQGMQNAGGQALMSQMSNPAQYAGGGLAAIGNMLGQAGSIGLSQGLSKVL